MSNTEVFVVEAGSEPLRIKRWTRFQRIFFGRKVVLFGAVIIAITAIVALAAPWIAPYDPNAIDLGSALEGPSSAHWLGTDPVGRDTLSRLIYGSRVSLGIGIVAVFFASIVGVALGAVAGYYGGWIHATVMRLVDALMSFPMILLALVVAALLGGGARNVVIALAVGLMPQYARLMTAQVMAIKNNDYVVAIKSIGASDWRIIVHHVMPNSFPPIVVQLTLRLGTAILTEASLSFLGIGVEPPTASWGSMVASGRDYLAEQPILSAAPGLAIMLVVFAFNMVGDGLRDAMDPRLRGRL